MSSIHEADEDDQVAVDNHQPGRGPCFRQLGRCVCFEAGGKGALSLNLGDRRGVCVCARFFSGLVHRPS